MGLCKCPRKKVTNQFCFEHKVNVCEYCMVDGAHKTCIVGPYLNWLENSNFENKCNLCQTDLNTSPTIRLCCYHIFHMQCVDSYASRFPPNTAPAGYTCPTCSHPIFAFSSKSPVAQVLENALRPYAWAKDGIDNGSTMDNQGNGQVNYSNSLLLNASTKISIPSTSDSIENKSFSQPKIVHNSLNKPQPSYTSAINVSNVTSFISTNSDLSFGSTSSMRSKFDQESRRSLLSVDDFQEDKYRTKSPIEFLSRWLRSKSTFVRNHRTMSSLNIYKRLLIFGFISILFLFIIIHYFIKYGRQSADREKFLDPDYDPNLRNDVEI